MSEYDNFIDKFRESLRHVESSIAIALNAHLEIEGNLDDYLNAIFAHPKYLHQARLSYYDKLAVARAYTPIAHDRPEWEMMTLINTIRNRIAHRNKDEVLQIDVSRLRAIVFQAFEKLQAELTGAAPSEVIIYATAICCGFLLVLTEEVSQTERVRIHSE
ncbi:MULTISPECIES: hypothetical protein [unclassified Bradyrhizobium]|uniref:hypothetical protein n=1 Tax=unclassified Bradyrhizobium TaxID=2631580 RepID=UPI00070E09DE|nr:MULTISPECIES: hypothetical protein [unclassified Bradyrhizobium]KQT17791.1 hypothetical protein ASG57_30525 [Bradyrhizobium sp. Leaf396]